MYRFSTQTFRQGEPVQSLYLRTGVSPHYQRLQRQSDESGTTSSTSRRNVTNFSAVKYTDKYMHDASEASCHWSTSVSYTHLTLPTKTVELSETSRGQLFTLGADYNERFAFKDPKPRQLKISPVMGNVLVRDGHRLDYETEPEIEFVVVVTRFDDVECKCFTLLNCVRAVEIKPK